MADVPLASATTMRITQPGRDEGCAAAMRIPSPTAERARNLQAGEYGGQTAGGIV